MVCLEYLSVFAICLITFAFYSEVTIKSCSNQYNHYNAKKHVGYYDKSKIINRQFSFLFNIYVTHLKPRYPYIKSLSPSDAYMRL